MTESICFSCNIKGTKFHKHHITYNPEFLAKICVECHSTITTINIIARQLARQSLKPDERIAIWELFLTKEPFALETYSGKRTMIIHSLCKHELAKKDRIIMKEL